MSAVSQLKLIGTSSNVQLNWSNLTDLSEVSPLQQFAVNCSSSGFPLPVVSWTREGTASPINSGYGFSTLSFKSIDRSISGRYMCQSDNGIPPVRRKNAIIHVYYPPNIKELTVVSTEQTDIRKQKHLLCVVEAHPAATVNWTSIGYHFIDTPNTTDASVSPFNSVIESRLSLAGIPNGEDAPREYTCSARNKFGFAERTVAFSEDKQERRWILAIIFGAGTTAGVLCVIVTIVFLRRGRCCHFEETVTAEYVKPIHITSFGKRRRPLPMKPSGELQDYPSALSPAVVTTKVFDSHQERSIERDYLTITEDQEEVTQETTLREPENYYDTPLEHSSLEPNIIPPPTEFTKMSPGCSSLDRRHEARFYSTKIIR
ncbi:kin of IRRE-like protein 2 [Diadema setosum]|uniref:kin of IRRE-like protein 2 n=1 Tax=Diadema setosum TaxID=31175 RepID=UPI003B3A1570